MQTNPETIVIDNKIFLLGLDYYFRKYQKEYETKVLLPKVEKIVAELEVKVASHPVEGYYAETPELTQYFNAVRTLQQTPEDKEINIKSVDDYKKVKEYINSSIFGVCTKNKILPQCVDTLTKALSETYPEWNVVNICNKAFSLAKDELEPSLVGVACLTRDPVVITAVRETVVLYAAKVMGAMKKVEITYEWDVDNLVQERANQLIEIFNKITGFSIPLGNPENASSFYSGYKENHDVVGRCVNLGVNEANTKFYHWAIKPDTTTKELTVEDFWDTKLWTSTEYKAQKLS